jgi:hypothetical protein
VSRRRRKRRPSWAREIPKGGGGIPSGTALSGREPKKRSVWNTPTPEASKADVKRHRRQLAEEQRYFERVVRQLIEVLQQIEP